MDVSVRVPAGMEAISVGRLESADTARRDGLRHLALDLPAADGDLPELPVHRSVRGQAGRRRTGCPTSMRSRSSCRAGQRQKAMAVMMTSGDRVRTLETMFGPYPFTEVGGIVPAHRFWFGGLETQTRPVYNAAAILDDDFAPELVDPRTRAHVVRRQRDAAAVERHLQQRGVRVLGAVGLQRADRRPEGQRHAQRPYERRSENRTSGG